MKIGRWSTTAANNNTTPPDGWPEGQAPSTVNDCAREMMASIRTMLNDVSFIDLAHTPTQTTSTTFTIPGDVTTFYDIGRRVKAFDASTLYGTVISSSFTTNTGITLRLDSGVLTSSLSSIGVSVLSPTNVAAPENTFKQSNGFINGMLEFWSSGTSFNVSGSAAGSVIVDMFTYNQNATASINVTRFERSANASNVPTLAQCGVLLNHSVGISVSAADAAIAASDYAELSYRMEGHDWRQRAGKINTVSFWVNSNRTGTYCMAVRNSGNDRSYAREYVISAASTWEKKTITVPEAPTAGTWDYSRGIGINVSFTLAAGTNFHATNNQWTSMNALATSSQTNFLASAGHTIKFACFKMNEGPVELPVEIVPTQQEQDKIRRYLQVIPASTRIMGMAISNTRGLYTYRMSPPMRSAPAVAAALGVYIVTNSAATGFSASAASLLFTNTDHITFDIGPVGTPFTAGNASELVTSASIVINATL